MAEPYALALHQPPAGRFYVVDNDEENFKAIAEPDWRPGQVSITGWIRQELAR